MADLADVANALVDAIAGVLFPAGGYVAATIATSAAGTPVRLYRGWPAPAGLDADITAGVANVTVYADPGVSRNTTRWLTTWQSGATPAATLTAGVDGLAVTVGGTATLGQVAGVAMGNGIAPAAYSYRILAGDTPATVAAALAALVSGATASDAVLTLPRGPVLARIGVDTPAAKITRQQTQRLSAHVWCPTPTARDILSAMLDAGLSDTTRLAASDGTQIRLTYAGTREFDAPGKASIWRRDLTWMAEYSTVQTEAQPAVLWPSMMVVPNGAILVADGPMQPSVEVYQDTDGNVFVDAAGSLMGVPA